MHLRMLATTLAASIGLIGSSLVAQTTPTTADTSIFNIAYRAVDARLPAGRRVVALNDPLLHVPSDRETDAELANRRFAHAVGLATTALDSVLTCPTSFECAFKDDIVATVSLALASRTPDSAVVELATQSLRPWSDPRAARTVTRRSVAVYEVTLARRAGRWIVTSVTPRAES